MTKTCKPKQPLGVWWLINSGLSLQSSTWPIEGYACYERTCLGCTLFFPEKYQMVVFVETSFCWINMRTDYLSCYSLDTFI